MCQIFYSSSTSNRPTWAQLDEAYTQNSDGNGIVYFDSAGNPTWEKDIPLKRISKLNRELMGPLFIHFRWTSSGANIPYLIHPHPIDGSQELQGTGSVLLHNGTVDDFLWQALLVKTDPAKLPEGSWSDSRALAYLVNIYGSNLLNMFATDNKFALIESINNIKFFGTWIKHSNGLFTSQPIWTMIQGKGNKQHRSAIDQKAIHPEVHDFCNV